jgi:hypothetical protein
LIAVLSNRASIAAAVAPLVGAAAIVRTTAVIRTAVIAGAAVIRTDVVRSGIAVLTDLFGRFIPFGIATLLYTHVSVGARLVRPAIDPRVPGCVGAGH